MAALGADHSKCSVSCTTHDECTHMPRRESIQPHMCVQAHGPGMACPSCPGWDKCRLPSRAAQPLPLLWQPAHSTWVYAHEHMHMHTCTHAHTDTDTCIYACTHAPVACTLHPVACMLHPVACTLHPVAGPASTGSSTVAMTCWCMHTLEHSKDWLMYCTCLVFGCAVRLVLQPVWAVLHTCPKRVVGVGYRCQDLHARMHAGWTALHT